MFRNFLKSCVIYCPQQLLWHVFDNSTSIRKNVKKELKIEHSRAASDVVHPSGRPGDCRFGVPAGGSDRQNQICPQLYQLHLVRCNWMEGCLLERNTLSSTVYKESSSTFDIPTPYIFNNRLLQRCFKPQRTVYSH